MAVSTTVRWSRGGEFAPGRWRWVMRPAWVLLLAGASLGRGNAIAVAIRRDGTTGEAERTVLHVCLARTDGSWLRAWLRTDVTLQVAHEEPPRAAPGLAWYHTDHLGTLRALGDARGQVVWRGDHLPFGEVLESVTSTGQEVRFPGDR